MTADEPTSRAGCGLVGVRAECVDDNNNKKRTSQVSHSNWPN